MKIPEEFKNHMQSIMKKAEFEQLMESYNTPRTHGFRINTLKISIEDFLKLSPFKTQSIPWCGDGFYYEAHESPGKHPYHYAGLYYIQEPSAMYPAEILNPQPNEKVLDLCAAPGGKTIQLAAKMKNTGLIVANDISFSRSKVLVKNIELCGVKNTAVTVETPEKLSKYFINYFDKILVDAPCSGEGMFRKDDTASKNWEDYKSSECTLIQKSILEHAAIMLKPGGRMVYSTCTFSPEENELQIHEFIKKHTEFKLVDISKTAGMECGRSEWCNGNKQLERTVRLWPHKIEGEGHFIALLKKDTDDDNIIINSISRSNNVMPKELSEFISNNLNIKCFNYSLIRKDSNLYCLPCEIPELQRIRCSKPGWYLGLIEKNKFIPSHAFVIALKSDELKNTINFDCESIEISKYLKGETLDIDLDTGLYGVCVDGHTLGWAKKAGMFKNLYPKGWRKLS